MGVVGGEDGVDGEDGEDGEDGVEGRSKSQGNCELTRRSPALRRGFVAMGHPLPGEPVVRGEISP